MKSRILLVSPLVSNVAGGVVKWTMNIFDYYQKITPPDENIELKPCYNENIQNSLTDKSLFGRIINGVNNYLPLIKKVRQELQCGNVDAVHLCTSASIALVKDIAITKLAKSKKVKCIVHFHFGRIPDIFKRPNWETWLIKKVIKNSDKVVVMDMASYKTLKEQGYNHVRYIPNPLSLDTQDFIENNENIKRIPNKVVFVGQMLKTKGIFELAQACRQIDNIKVRFIGPVPNKEIEEGLKTLVETNKMEICGTMPFEQVIKEMLSASVFVLPTYTEGFPNVIIESMACGCPIVTTPVGAIPEILDIDGEKCGICVPVKDVEALRKAISYMIENPEEAAKMGKRAKDRVYKVYSIQKVWKELEQVWL